MATAVKITTVGDSVGIVLPKEMLSHLNVEKGDKIFVSKIPGGLYLAPYEEGLAVQMEAARAIMGENRDVLRKLAE